MIPPNMPDDNDHVVTDDKQSDDGDVQETPNGDDDIDFVGEAYTNDPEELIDIIEKQNDDTNIDNEQHSNDAQNEMQDKFSNEVDESDKDVKSDDEQQHRRYLLRVRNKRAQLAIDFDKKTYLEQDVTYLEQNGTIHINPMVIEQGREDLRCIPTANKTKSYHRNYRTQMLTNIADVHSECDHGAVVQLVQGT